MGPVEQAVRAKFKGGDTLYTVSNREPFTIGVIDTDGIVLMLGRKQSSAPLSWECLESVPAFLRNTPGWVPAGGNHSVAGEPGTLDQHLKGYLNKDVARWLARVLTDAGIVELSVGPPLSLRLPQYRRPIASSALARVHADRLVGH